MATQIGVNDILQVRVWSSMGDQAAVNSYNFECVAVTGGSVTDQQLATGFDPFMATFYKAYMCDSASYDGVQVYFMRRTGVLPAPVQETASAGSGAAGTDALPSNTAVIGKYRSVARGPAGRGRVFLPFAATTATTAIGFPTAGINTLVTGFLGTLLTPTVVGTSPNTATLVWGIFHRAFGTIPASLSQILSAQSAQKFGQMHKRGQYGRPNSSPI